MNKQLRKIKAISKRIYYAADGHPMGYVGPKDRGFNQIYDDLDFLLKLASDPSEQAYDKSDAMDRWYA